MKIGEVVLSRNDIANLDSRCDKAGPKAEHNHEQHCQWYAQWEKDQAHKRTVRNSPQTRTRVGVERAVNHEHRPGTIGYYLQNKG